MLLRNMPLYIKYCIAYFRKDSLLRNSVYLMLATGVLAGFGFFFWLIVAKTFSTADIGVATALVSAMNLIAYLSLMGFNVAFVRFTPSAQDKNGNLNTGLLVATAAAIVFSIAFILIAPHISMHLSLIGYPLFAAGFVLFCIATTLNLLTDSVFIANREARYILFINTAYSAAKIGLPLLFLSAGAFGIVTAAALAQALGLGLSILAMMHLFAYRPHLTLKSSVLGQVWRYCASNYVASIFSLLPATVMPLMVIGALGPEPAAYFYIAMMIGNLLYVIPWSITRALFAEGSHDEVTLLQNAKKAMFIIGALLTPAILFLALFGSFILSIFGRGYAQGNSLLLLLALAGFAVAVMAIANAIFLVTKQSREVVVLNVTFAIATIALVYALLPLGLYGVGVGWLVGNAIAALAGYLLFRRESIMTSWWKNFNIPITIIVAKWRYLRASFARGDKRTILFYPHKPQHFHILYAIVHELGYAVTTNPSKCHELAIAFEDQTIRSNEHHAVLQELARTQPVANLNCADISKENIEKIFRETYGYNTFVNPEQYSGRCVRKSNNNSTHDGVFIACPAAKEPGYVYQKFIECEHEGRIADLRGIIMGGKLRHITLKYKAPEARFDITSDISMRRPDTLLSAQEIEGVESFCKSLGLDCGEMDILRDKTDGKIYIIDVSNTSGGPVRNLHLPAQEYDAYVQMLSESFARAYGLAIDARLTVVVQ
ncbi:MAG: lipopolysaccharide biosynthesis protein [Patescibacteria group bacterium]|nr:lipopolysaccharide biosynthesis protein [Patescibacteria group bacterium]